MRILILLLSTLIGLSCSISAIAAQGSSGTEPDNYQLLPISPEPMEVTLSIEEAFQRRSAIVTSAGSERTNSVLHAIVAVEPDEQLLLILCSGGSYPPADCKPKAQFRGTSARIDSASFYGTSAGPVVWVTTNTSVFLCDFFKKEDFSRPWKNCVKMADIPVDSGTPEAAPIVAAAQYPETGRSTIAWLALPRSLTGLNSSSLYRCIDFGRHRGCAPWRQIRADILALDVDMQENYSTDAWITTTGSFIRCDSSPQAPRSCKNLWFLGPTTPSLSID